ncbi:MAG: hypothetical protein PG979_000146 [Rickettsia asembonensis]|uniref:Uncharacterized protein n=1 Tax=Rickettsia asembonensis TaxID=1068590 RepID=A0A0C2MLV6_9RICK|nr:hypothetical protein SB78_07185 [Rickettsia asembonensis]KIJ88211.1 hypothetical protein SB78_07210 [Rickettsia asembonensis]KIJ88214.1 hypothetical protein SB78_07015 [Rickettsia asembonensis]KIJ88300.1 hypothetical protein SB78_06645 [Rickettsia asembonensis]WCR56089.1 MAG: hypothetical protein PG979_000146 [Rickettsia asembonensis]
MVSAKINHIDDQNLVLESQDPYYAIDPQSNLLFDAAQNQINDIMYKLVVYMVLGMSLPSQILPLHKVEH